MAGKNKCYFCDKIFAEEVKVEKIYDSEYVFAYYNLKPEYEKDIIIVPKKHINNLIELKAEDEIFLWEMIKVGKYVAKSLLDEYKGAKLFTEMGDQQVEKHLTFRLIAGKKI
jgi:histidine triad (HIT) family protein